MMNNASGFDQIDTIGERQSAVEILLDEQDAETLLSKRCNVQPVLAEAGFSIVRCSVTVSDENRRRPCGTNAIFLRAISNEGMSFNR